MTDVLDILGAILAGLTVFVAMPLSWYVAWRLWRLSRGYRANRVIRQQAIAAVALALIVTLFAIVFINNDQQVPPLTPAQTRVMTRGALLLLSVIPALYWLYLYRGRE